MQDTGATGDAESDAALVRAVSEGDAQALTRLYRRHRNQVYRFAWAMSRSRPIAEDATQDTFLNVIEQAYRFDPRHGNVMAWLLGCARNKVVDRLRLLPLLSEVAEEAGHADILDNLREQESRRSRLHQAITALPLPFREVIVLCDLQEISYADSAVILDCPIGTVRSRLSRARQMLRAALSPETPLENTHRALQLDHPGITPL